MSLYRVFLLFRVPWALLVILFSCWVNLNYRYVSCLWLVNHVLYEPDISCSGFPEYVVVDFYGVHWKLIVLISSFLRSILPLIRSCAWFRNSTSVASSRFSSLSSFVAWRIFDSCTACGIHTMSLIDRASMATPATMYFTQSIGAVGIHFLGGDSSFHSSLESQPISELFIHRTCPAHSNPLHIRIFEAVSSISSISTVFPMWSHAIMVACIELFFLWNTPLPCLVPYGYRVRCSRDFKLFFNTVQNREVPICMSRWFLQIAQSGMCRGRLLLL